MIRANCRDRLTADDFDFIRKSLGTERGFSSSLEALLTDSETRDLILDDEELLRAVLESPDRLRISPQLFFYLVCRRVLKETSVSTRDAADYVASLLEHFSRTQRMEGPPGARQAKVQYVSDMLIALQNVDHHEAFLLRAHIGNYTLFLSGLFSDAIRRRTERGAPDIWFYEQIGRSNFHLASEHRDAARFGLDRIFEELARGFHEARLALNDLASRLLHFESHPPLPTA